MRALPFYLLILTLLLAGCLGTGGSQRTAAPAMTAVPTDTLAPPLTATDVSTETGVPAETDVPARTGVPTAAPPLPTGAATGLPTTLPRPVKPGGLPVDEPTPGKETGLAETGLVSWTELDGQPVFDRQGEPIGAVDSLVLEEDSGQILYVLIAGIASGGADGEDAPIPEDRLAAAPWNTLAGIEAIQPWRLEKHPPPEKQVLVFDREVIRLQNAPSAPAGEGEEPLDLAAWTAELAAYWEFEEQIPVTGGDVDPHLLRLGAGEDLRVLDPAGKPLGRANGLLVDLTVWKVRYLVITAAGRPVAVPFERFQVRRDDEAYSFILAADRDRLAAAPTFDPGAAASPAWQALVDGYWEE